MKGQSNNFIRYLISASLFLVVTFVQISAKKCIILSFWQWSTTLTEKFIVTAYDLYKHIFACVKHHQTSVSTHS